MCFSYFNFFFSNGELCKKHRYVANGSTLNQHALVAILKAYTNAYIWSYHYYISYTNITTIWDFFSPLKKSIDNKQTDKSDSTLSIMVICVITSEHLEHYACFTEANPIYLQPFDHNFSWSVKPLVTITL